MSRGGYPKVYRNGRLVSKAKASPLGSGAYIISDAMQALVHPMTGKMMDSKSQFRAVTRAKGGIEVGNETLTPRPRRVDMPEMRVSIDRAMRELGI